MKKVDLQVKENSITGGKCCVFKHNGEYYYVDKSFVFGVGYETMIFPCNEEGEVTNWGELYMDRSGKSLEDCILEFCLDN